MRTYLDTSVFSAYYDERTPERMQATREFWVTLERYELLCSNLTTEELEQAETKLAGKLKSLMRGFHFVSLNPAMRDLANVYVHAGVVPVRYLDDALHIAAAVYGDADVLVSWNFKHMVKRNTRLLVNYLNAQRGLRSIEMLPPPEL